MTEEKVIPPPPRHLLPADRLRSLVPFPQHNSEDAGVREVCEANGLNENAFVRESHLLQSLDLFMSGLRDLGCLSYFGGLTAIRFINLPNLTSVSGLDACCPGQYHLLR